MRAAKAKEEAAKAEAEKAKSGKPGAPKPPTPLSEALQDLQAETAEMYAHAADTRKTFVPHPAAAGVASLVGGAAAAASPYKEVRLPGTP